MGRPPVWDVHPAATCRGFLSFTKERGKKSVTKGRPCPLRCFHPSEKGQMCPLSGSWQLRPGQRQASARGERWSQWGPASQSLDIWARIWNQVCVACPSSNSDCTSLYWDAWSEPTSGVSTDNAPRPRSHQGWDGSSRGDWFP